MFPPSGFLTLLTAYSSLHPIGLFHPTSTYGLICPESVSTLHEQAALRETDFFTTSCRPQAIYTMQLKVALPMRNSSCTPMFPSSYNIEPSNGTSSTRTPSARCHATRTCTTSYEVWVAVLCKQNPTTTRNSASHSPAPASRCGYLCLATPAYQRTEYVDSLRGPHHPSWALASPSSRISRCLWAA
jgi:hypothetical protein